MRKYLKTIALSMFFIFNYFTVAYATPQVQMPDMPTNPNSNTNAQDVFQSKYGDKWNNPKNQLDKSSGIPDDQVFNDVINKNKSQGDALLKDQQNKQLDTSKNWDFNSLKGQFALPDNSDALANAAKPAGWDAAMSANSTPKGDWLKGTPKPEGYGLLNYIEQGGIKNAKSKISDVFHYQYAVDQQTGRKKFLSEKDYKFQKDTKTGDLIAIPLTVSEKKVATKALHEKDIDRVLCGIGGTYAVDQNGKHVSMFSKDAKGVGFDWKRYIANPMAGNPLANWFGYSSTYDYKHEKFFSLDHFLNTKI